MTLIRRAPCGSAIKTCGCYTLRPTKALLSEFLTSTPVPEWGGQRITIALEDDIILTDDGVRFVYPPISHILLVH